MWCWFDRQESSSDSASATPSASGSDDIIPRLKPTPHQAKVSKGVGRVIQDHTMYKVILFFSLFLRKTFVTITATAIAAMRQDDNWNLCDIFFMSRV